MGINGPWAGPGAGPSAMGAQASCAREGRRSACTRLVVSMWTRRHVDLLNKFNYTQDTIDELECSSRWNDGKALAEASTVSWPANDLIAVARALLGPRGAGVAGGEDTAMEVPEGMLGLVTETQPHGQEEAQDKAVEALQLFHKSSRRAGWTSEMDFMKLWKGLFYCMWMSDKTPVQQELAAMLASLRTAC